jgi:DNA-binding LytR/AlgR family response regulator
MSTLRVGVVEDEPLARQRLIRLLKEAGCEVGAQWEDGLSFLDGFEECGPLDALFLDIHLPELSGMDALNGLKNPPPVIFVTAHPEHAAEAFERDAVDYVLKPISANRLAATLERLRRHLIPRRSGEELRALLNGEQRYAVKAEGGHLFVELRKTTHFIVEDEIVFAFVAGRRFRTAWGSLAEVESTFPKSRMLRIQRHVLVRPETVIGLRNTLGGGGVARLNDGSELDVSRRAKQTLKDVLGI